MREKKKFDALPSGSATVKARKWVFYDAMTFLTPCVTPRATSSNVSSPLKKLPFEHWFYSRATEVFPGTSSFLLSLLPLMKQLSPMDNSDAKIEIQQIFRRKLASE
ncbi:uncharacterized protein LOC126991922 [Eriocheir sinensis]|uniref:uncharacterized protein LOC126991922 n=1 Tax=Eriocheir sinensis TaxID=95602 RepID=UPI0021C88C10|nr:uncharacterized protein LOC126991922 [Eriocheir sinensis]